MPSELQQGFADRAAGQAACLAAATAVNRDDEGRIEAALATPSWATDIQRFAFGEVAYSRTATSQVVATAVHHGESGHPLEISVDVWDVVEDDGTVQRTEPQVLLYDTWTNDTSFTFSVEQARALRDALDELIAATDRGAA